MDTIEAFWEWFGENQMRLKQMGNRGGDTFVGLAAALKQIDPELVFDIGVLPDAEMELVISADEKVAKFPLVMRVVSAAPADLKGWRVTAFRQPKKAHVALTFDGLTVQSDRGFFTWRRQPDGKIGLTAFIEDFNRGDSRYEKAVYLLLLNLAGEYAMAKKIGTIAMETFVPGEHEGQGLEPLIVLGERVANVAGSD